MTKAELDALEDELNRQKKPIHVQIAAYKSLHLAPRLIADHRRLVELLQRIYNMRDSRTQREKLGREAAEYLRQWEEKT